MTRLAPDLFRRRFRDLVEIGRAHLPALAPEWTDHNAHDPGIMLMELLAWVAESQLYSLSRMRRDERAAYAALLGVPERGTRGARGLIWPDRDDPNRPELTFQHSRVLDRDVVIQVEGTEKPTFRPAEAILWTPGKITQLVARNAQGDVTDLTAMNERGGLPFLPFGESAGRREVLALTFTCNDDAGLFGKNRAGTRGALWPIGVLVAPPVGEVTDPGEECGSPLAVTVVTEEDRFDVRVRSDSTRGFLTSGVVLLDLDNVPSLPPQFTLELRPLHGLPRAPRVLRIEPNVVPIVQGRTILREQQTSTGAPDWRFLLEKSGLRFAAGEEPIQLEVGEGGAFKVWRRCERLTERGADENVYQLDVRKGEVSFGNQVNGRIPPAGSDVYVTYAVSDGELGRVARNRKWSVAGFASSFGSNLDPITGGLGFPEIVDDRREARRRVREERALVSTRDVVAAALGLPLLDVARAWVPKPKPGAAGMGQVTLVALRRQRGGEEPAVPPESALWLESIRQRLLPRMPLGTRLVVRPPRYVEFSMEVVLEAGAGLNPVQVEKEVRKVLKERLALEAWRPGVRPRQPGVPVTFRDVKAWLRGVSGVSRVLRLKLRDTQGRELQEVKVPSGGLPRWLTGGTTIEINRPEPRRPR